MVYERSLSEEELKYLNKRIVPLKFKHFWVFAIWPALAIVGVILFCCYLKADLLPVPNLALVVLVAAGVGWMLNEELKTRKKNNSIQYLIAQNRVKVVAVQSDEFYLLDEEEDEGVDYLYQLPNNKVLSFGGQDYYESDNFPNNHFEIVIGQGLKNEYLIFQINVLGEKIEPKKIIPGYEKWKIINHPHYPNPDDFTVAEGKIEDYITL